MLSLVAFYGLNATEPLFRPDYTVGAEEEVLLIASSLRRLNYSFVLIGAIWREASSYALVMVLPIFFLSMSHLLQKSRKLKLRLLQLRQTQSPTRSVRIRLAC